MKKETLLFYWSAFVFLLHSAGSITNPEALRDGFYWEAEC